MSETPGTLLASRAPEESHPQEIPATVGQNSNLERNEMKKQYVLSAEEYQNLVPKSELEGLQEIIDRTTEACVEVAFKRGNCMKGGGRRYCVHYPAYDNQRNCSFWKMCHSEMKRYEDAPRELDHMIE